MHFVKLPGFRGVVKSFSESGSWGGGNGDSSVRGSGTQKRWIREFSLTFLGVGFQRYLAPKKIRMREMSSTPKSSPQIWYLVQVFFRLLDASA